MRPHRPHIHLTRLFLLRTPFCISLPYGLAVGVESSKCSCRMPLKGRHPLYTLLRHVSVLPPKQASRRDRSLLLRCLHTSGFSPSLLHQISPRTAWDRQELRGSAGRRPPGSMAGKCRPGGPSKRPACLGAEAMGSGGSNSACPASNPNPSCPRPCRDDLDTLVYVTSDALP